jgi:hypothetical protein
MVNHIEFWVKMAEYPWVANKFTCSCLIPSHQGIEKFNIILCFMQLSWSAGFCFISSFKKLFHMLKNLLTAVCWSEIRRQKHFKGTVLQYLLICFFSFSTHLIFKNTGAAKIFCYNCKIFSLQWAVVGCFLKLIPILRPRDHSASPATI